MPAPTRNGSRAYLLVDRWSRSLVDVLGSPRLTRVDASLMGEMRLCMAQVQTYKLLRIIEIADEHPAILTAIADGDPEVR
ncbi:hypothetical protein [Streptomyces sp. NPDC002324]